MPIDRRSLLAECYVCIPLRCWDLQPSSSLRGAPRAGFQRTGETWTVETRLFPSDLAWHQALVGLYVGGSRSSGVAQGSTREQREIYFQGRVQGVGFRYTTRRIAAQFDVAGYVQNLPDGRVFLVAVGEPAELDRFVQAIDIQLGRYIRTGRIDPTRHWPIPSVRDPLLMDGVQFAAEEANQPDPIFVAIASCQAECILLIQLACPARTLVGHALA